MLHKILFASALLLELSFLQADAHQCYFCGPLRNGFNRTCEGFDLNPANYVFDCPAHYHSCSTHFEGINTIRQCEKMKQINDCKMANEIKYCYCSANLCNGVKEMVQEEAAQDTDDEDILGETGSGDSTPPPTDKRENINVVIQTVGGNQIDENEKVNGGAKMAPAAISCLIIVFASNLVC